VARSHPPLRLFLCFELLTCKVCGERKRERERAKKEEYPTTTTTRDTVGVCTSYNSQLMPRTERERERRRQDRRNLARPFFSYRLLPKSSFSWRLCSVGSGSFHFLSRFLFSSA
jgi:hypothetical protein